MNFADVFSVEETLVPPKCTKLNKQAIKRENGKQPPYRLIYSLKLVELETLKIYIETYLKTEFIQPSKSSVSAFIFFNKKFDGNLCLYGDYWGFNNFTIKN